MNPRKRKQISVLSMCPGTFVQEFERHTHTEALVQAISAEVQHCSHGVATQSSCLTPCHKHPNSHSKMSHCLQSSLSEAQAHLMISFPSLTGDVFLPCLTPRGPGMERAICIFLLLLLHEQKASPANVQLLLSREPERTLHFSGADNAGKQSWTEGLSPAQAEPRQSQLPCPGTAQKGAGVSTQSWHLQDWRDPAVLLPWALQCASHVRFSETGILCMGDWFWKQE